MPSEKNMKLVLFLVSIFLATGGYAQAFNGLFGVSSPQVDFGENLTDGEASRLITVLDEKTWKLRMEEGSALAKKIPINSRYTLYEKYKISGAWGLLNLYGVGSFFQGDPGTSFIALGGIALFEATVITSANYSRDRPEHNIWLATGASVAGAAFLYGLVRPWFFADEQNRALKEMFFGKE